MNLIAIVNDTEEIIETMWGDPNRWDDWQRRIYKMDLTLLKLHREEGYCLKMLDLYEVGVNPGNGSIEKMRVNPLGITNDSIITIKGPLYRADTFAFREFELGVEEKSVYAVPFQGHNGTKKLETTYYDGDVKKDHRRNMPILSLKTASHAVGYLPEYPISLLNSHRSPPAGLMLLRDLADRGPIFARQKYFTSRED